MSLFPFWLRYKLFSLFRTPVTFNWEDARLSKKFKSLAWGTMVIATLFLGTLVLFQPELLRRALAAIAVVDGAGLLLLGLNRLGHPRLASGLFLATLLCLIGAMALSAGGIRSPGIGSFFLFSLMGGLLLGQRGALLTAGACLSISMGLLLLERAGALPAASVSYSPITLWALHTLYLSVMLLLVRDTVKDLTASLTSAKDEMMKRRLGEQKLELALSAAEVGTWEYDPALREFQADEKAFALLGLSRPVSGKIDLAAWMARVAPADLERVMGTLEATLGGQKHLKVDHWFEHPSGAKRFVRVAMSPLWEKSERPIKVVGLVQDATEVR